MSSHLPASYPKAPVETLTMLQELVDGLLGDMDSVSEASRRLIEATVHDQINKILLYRSAVAMHKMKESGKILRGLSLCGEHMTDPEYIRIVATDPTALQNHVKTLLTWEKQNREERDKHVQGVLDRQAGVEGGTTINNYFGDAAQPVLPGELKSGARRRKLQQAFAMLLEAVEGRTASPPESQSRVIDADFKVKEDEEPDDSGQQPPRE